MTPFAPSSASEARVRSPGESESAGRATCSAPSPNLASSERASLGTRPLAVSNRARSGASPENIARAWSSSPTITPGPSHRSPPSIARRPTIVSSKRGLAAAVRADDRDPLAVLDLEIDGTEREVAAVHDRAREPGHDRAAAGRGGDLHPQVPALERLVDRVGFESGQRPVGDLGLGRHVLTAVPPELADVLVGLARLLQLRLPLHRPLPLPLGPIDEVPALGAVARVLLLGVAPSGGVLVEIRLPAARVLGGGVRVLVELEHRGDGAVEELAVVRDDDRAAAQLVAQELLEAFEPGEVEVVRRLVEEEHVEPGEHDRGEARPGRLPTRQRGHLEVEHARREPEVGAHRADPRVEVGRAEPEVTLERVGVGVVGPRRLLGERGRRGVERLLRGRDTRCAERGTHARSRPGAVRAPAAGSRPSRTAE